MPAAIEVNRLSKRFGPIEAVSDLSFEVNAGRVTGFLGPNGSGKTTTLRILLGLVGSTEGSATFGGRRYVDLDRPIHHVGAVLEATSFHPSRRAEDHLRAVAMAAGIRANESAKHSNWLGWATKEDVGSASSHWACASGCSWPPPCWASPRS